MGLDSPKKIDCVASMTRCASHTADLDRKKHHMLSFRFRYENHIVQSPTSECQCQTLTEQRGSPLGGSRLRTARPPAQGVHLKLLWHLWFVFKANTTLQPFFQIFDSMDLKRPTKFGEQRCTQCRCTLRWRRSALCTRPSSQHLSYEHDA